MPFPYVEVSGTPYAMGLQHGRQAGDRIAGFVEHLVTAAGRPRAEVLAAARRFLPAFERGCPKQVEEVRGVAAGAGLVFEEALLVQVRGEVLPHLRAEGCTSFAVAGRHPVSGAPLIGQTSDMEPTDNAAERAVRLGVLWRKVSLFTQSARGRTYVERILTVKTTLRQQGGNLLEFLTQSLRTARTGAAAPKVFAGCSAGGVRGTHAPPACLLISQEHQFGRTPHPPERLRRPCRLRAAD